MISYPSINKTSAAHATSEILSLDVVVLNAGIIMSTYEQSEHGWEKTLQVNTLSTTLLGMLVLPKPKASKTADCTPTLEIVGSGVHQVSNLTRRIARQRS